MKTLSEEGSKMAIERLAALRNIKTHFSTYDRSLSNKIAELRSQEADLHQKMRELYRVYYKAVTAIESHKTQDLIKAEASEVLALMRNVYRI